MPLPPAHGTDVTQPRVTGPLRNLSSGDVVADRYRLIGVLGRGGMGEVWEAEHATLRRNVALKLVYIDADVLRTQLLHEARLLASLRHPAIVAVHDAGVTADGVAYLAMDLLVGENLATRIMRERLPVRDAVVLFVEILDGLTAAHAAGIVHRDIKPDNIVLVVHDARVVPTLIDFGIAVPMTNDAPERAGTPQYMAPEQLRGLVCDARIDVWATCISLYEACTGRVPFDGPDLTTTASNVFTAPLPFPTDVAGLDGKLWSILTRGLRKDPIDRTASATELRDALATWLARQPGAPAPTAVAPAPVARNDSSPSSIETLIKRMLTEA